MGANLSVGGSVPHPGCDAAALSGSSFPYYYLSPECVWELATTRGGLAVALSLVLILVVRYSTSPWRRVPPGPRGLPLIGNVLELRDKVWLFQKDCKQKYEDVLYLSALGQPILVLNSLKAASELLDRRSNIYSGCPHLIMAQEIVSGSLIFVILNHVDDRWRRSRRAAHQVLTKAAVRDYHNVLRKEGVLLASALLANPGDVEKHIQRTAASATMSILYDYPTLRTDDDKNLKGILAFADRMSQTVAPGAYLVELFPWMLHIPERFARWKYEGNRDFTRFNNLFESLFNRVLSALSEEMAWFAGTLFTAGSETTSTTMSWWALAMIAHPEVQKRAHIELDTVVGRSRVNGMFIPKGAICLTNLIQCHRDPSSYGDDAADFRPERFLGAHGEILPGPAETHEDGHASFGFGKRACVGKHITNESLFINIATALWAMTLERACDKDGNEVPVDVDTFVDTGMTLYASHPLAASNLAANCT
ncbi:cytochrome P450 [Lactarius indigo]|nr:cytochrome P450 [Lactarius indigo]